MSIIIRPAVEADIGNMVILLEILFSLEKDFTSDPIKQKKGLSLLLHSENAEIYVAENDHTLVGMITGQLVISTAEGSLSLLVEDLVILESHRGNGIGTNLLEHISNWAKANGASRMQLLADKDNLRALSFYQSNSWQPTNLIHLRKYNSS